MHKCQGLREKLQAFLEQHVPMLEEEDEQTDPLPAVGFQRVIQRAILHVKFRQARSVTGAQRSHRDLCREGFPCGVFPG